MIYTPVKTEADGKPIKPEPQYVVVLDLYGYASLYTWDEWCSVYGRIDPEYRPNYKEFQDREAAIVYRDQQTEYTRKRLSNE